jgi:hypothetical protein
MSKTDDEINITTDTKVPEKCQGCDLVVIDHDGSFIKCTVDCDPDDDEDSDCVENNIEW